MMFSRCVYIYQCYYLGQRQGQGKSSNRVIRWASVGPFLPEPVPPRVQEHAPGGGSSEVVSRHSTGLHHQNVCMVCRYMLRRRPRQAALGSAQVPGVARGVGSLWVVWGRGEEGQPGEASLGLCPACHVAMW